METATTTAQTTPENLSADLDGFIGTEHYYRDELGRTKKDLEWTRGERDRLFALAHERGKKLDQEVE